jgi:hypothetical protein
MESMARDWKSKNIELIQEASRHAEAKLAAQLQIATSADQRAAVLGGIYVAAATGIIGALASGAADNLGRPLMIGAFLSAAAFLIGAYLCIFAMLPISFDIPGNEPSNWYDDIDQNRDLKDAIGEQLDCFDEAIRENNRRVAKNARLFKAGALIGISAPLLGIVVAGLNCLLMPH